VLVVLVDGAAVLVVVVVPGAAVVVVVGAAVLVGAAVVVGVGLGVGAGVGDAVVGMTGGTPMYVATAVMWLTAAAGSAPALGRTVKLTMTLLPDAAKDTPVICDGATPRTAASACW
jgi:hypothetical protein